MHAPIAIAALDSGKHVLCEKPMGRSLEEAEGIVSAARRSTGRFKVGYNLRCHPAIILSKEWCNQGRLGKLMFVRGRYGIGGRPGFESEWRVRIELSGGGELMDQGLHLLDLSRWFLGDFEEVFGVVPAMYWSIAPVEDNAFALLKSRLGQVALLHASWTQWINLFSFEVFGTEGYCAVEGLGGGYGTECAILGKRQFTGPFQQEVFEFRGEDKSWSTEWTEFRTAIREGHEMGCSAIDGREALRLADAIYTSARSGRAASVGNS
jgi:predicted dehydrogenase